MDDGRQFVPHPSYALEDSSGESDFDEDELPSHLRQSVQEGDKPLQPDSKVELRGALEGLQKAGEVVWLTGEAGERLAQGAKLSGSAAVEVFVDGVQAGAIYAASNGATLVFLTTALPLASLHPLASTLLTALQPSISTILASYHLPSYIPSSDSPSTSSAPILFLASPSPSSSITSLQSAGALTPFTPPNLLHGLPSILLMLSSLQPSTTRGSTLLALPTTTPPQPLNGPFSPLSPISQGGGMSIYDAGGPTGLSDPGALFRELAGAKGPLRKVKEELGWGWWDSETKEGKAFEWLEKSRKERRREENSSMYM